MPKFECRIAVMVTLALALAGCGDVPSEKGRTADAGDTAPNTQEVAAPEPEPVSDESEDEGMETYGLPRGEGRDEVIAYCGACHSLKLVTQQGLSREDWAKILDLMYEEHGMPPLEPEAEWRVLEYLAENLDPESQKERLREQGIIR